jgi:branched-chain amino acid aminotransferase
MPSSNFPVTAVQQSRLSRVDFDQLGFGAIFSDHMFSMSYQNGEWINPEIQPYQPIALEPGVSMLHYGQTVFDGYKAFRGVDGEVRIFRPDMNAKRLHDSCRRLCIPIMDAAELSDIMIQATRQLIELDQDWIPRQLGQSLYVRPLIIGTEATLEVRAANSYRFLIMTSPVGSYFTNLGKGVSLRVEDRFTRAASIGGLGAAKTAANYAASLLPGFESKQQGFDQVLWLDGNEHRYVEEVGAMNSSGALSCRA